MKPTLKGIAAELKVSTMTVSLVLSGKSDGRVSAELAGKIRQTAADMGYRENRLAKAMRTGVIPLIALCIHEAKDGSATPNLYWFDLVSSAKLTFAAEKMEVLFVTYSDVEELEERITTLRDANMIGGVISNLDIPGKDGEICRVLEASGLPCVLFGKPPADGNIPYSVIRSEKMEAAMLEFLKTQGARELRWFGRNSDLPLPADAADPEVFFHVSNELSRNKLIHYANIPPHRIVVVSYYASDLGGHQGFLVRSHTQERCLHALQAIRQQTNKEAVTEFSKVIELTGEDFTWSAGIGRE